MSKPRVLMILHMPPPVHGASMVGQFIHDSQVINDQFDCRYINLSTSEKMDEIGAFSLRKIRKLFSISREALREVDIFKPDLVYLTPSSTGLGFFKDQLLVARLKRKGCRIVLHFHNKGVEAHSGNRLYDRLYRRFFRGVKVMQLSERLYPDIARYVPREAVFFCPNGAEAAPVEKIPTEGGPRLLFLSNLLISKGVVVLLDALALIKNKGIPFTCRLVGKESADMNADAMNRAIGSRQLSDCVVYDGPRYGPDKWKALAAADLFVFPTFYPNECFPVVLLEAFAAALPVVTTDEGAIPDIVEDGVNGLICRKQDPESLAAALEKLLSQPTLMAAMGSANREKFRSEYTLPVFEHRFVDILAKILDA